MEWDNDSVVYECTLQAVQQRVNSLAWSTTGTHLLACYENDSVVTSYREFKNGPWTMKAGFSRKHGAEQTKFVGNSTILSLALSPFGKDKSTTARVWDMQHNRFLVEMDFKARVMRGNGICHHPTSNLFLANLLNGTVMLQTTDNTRPIACFECDKDAEVGGETWYRQFNPVSCFDPTTPTIAIAANKWTIKLLDSRHLTQGEYASFSIEKLLGSPKDWIRTVQFTPLTGNLLVTSSLGQMWLLDPCSGSVVNDFAMPTHIVGSCLRTSQPRPESSCPSSVAHFACGFGYPEISPDEAVVACGVWDRRHAGGTVQLWDARFGSLIHSIGRFPDIPYHLSFNPVMSQLAVGDLTTTSWVLQPKKESLKDKRDLVGGPSRKR